MFSAFVLNSQMAFMTAVTILFAIIADFLLLPPLLMALDRGPGAATEAGEQSSAAFSGKEQTNV